MVVLMRLSRRCVEAVFIYMGAFDIKPSTYDHTYQKIRDPVRSPIVKLVRGGLVVGSVTTSESPLLYVSLFAISINSESSSVDRQYEAASTVYPLCLFFCLHRNAPKDWWQ